MNDLGLACRRISVRGVVQGVGFRPFVYRLARDHSLSGWVLNHSGGVEIEVEGPLAALDAFVHDLTSEAPPLAHIVGVDIQDVPPNGYERFEIRHSVAQEGRYQLISPDIATCVDCRRELLNPADRRYRYPFTNCTNCGPRFTIIRDIPYDRPLTTMQPFVMCPDCQREYEDPLDRRFHAQPNACPVCGPQVWVEASGTPGTRLAERDEAVRLAGQLLLAGKILAIKGLGGFHLACDATNAEAVRTLRARKGRPAKPLAVMVATLDDARRYCHLSAADEALLTSQQCPIVLLRWRDDTTGLQATDVVREVAPGNLYLGLMLPYTPLHHILLRDVARPLVMTSGNLTEEPIAQDNDEARRRLGPLADAFLMHNRDIYARYDDSVLTNVQIPMSRSQFPDPEPPASHILPLRRARGYAPFPIRLPFRVRQILAVGAELKNTFCLTRDDFAFVSQHIGDMENLETLEHLEKTVTLYRHLFRIEPEIIAHDLHPDYSSTQYASHLAVHLAHVPIQHHQAHIAACLADNGWKPDDGPVIGVAWDGTGYGLDGSIWGGEFFVGDYCGFRRTAHLETMPMPGGEVSIHQPWRLALGYLYALTGTVPTIQDISDQEARIVCLQVDRGLNTPLTSAAGRLFDAVAALTGVRHTVTYEAQAAIELEMLATRWAATGSSRTPVVRYPYEIEDLGDSTVIRLSSLFQAIQADLAAGVTPGEIGYRFHETMAEVIAVVCRRIADETGLTTAALSGGCFQNRMLLAMAVPRLEREGLRVLIHRQVPCNDGGISLGQATMAHWAAATELKKARS